MMITAEVAISFIAVFFVVVVFYGIYAMSRD
jgi:hypothetical protein